MKTNKTKIMCEEIRKRMIMDVNMYGGNRVTN